MVVPLRNLRVRRRLGVLSKSSEFDMTYNSKIKNNEYYARKFPTKQERRNGGFEATRIK
jgi:hypothetical protein